MTGTNRIEAFSDGVMAIVLTIMVLELKAPQLDKTADYNMIRQHVLHVAPYFGAYAFSFMMIVIFWNNHHQMFHLLDRIDNTLLWMNAFFLFFLSLVPFVTSIVGANVSLPFSVALYGGVMLLTSFSFTVMRTYTLKKGFEHKDEEENLTKVIRSVSVKTKMKSLIGTAAYIVGIPLAFVSVYLSYICFLIPPILFFLPDGIDDEELAERVDEKNK